MGRGTVYLMAFVAAIAAGVTGFTYCSIRPSRQTMVIDSAQGFLDLLFVAWYMVMGIAVGTVLLGLFCFLFKPPKGSRFMAVPYGLMALAWGLAWLLLMIAVISIAKRNEECKAIAGDVWKDGEFLQVCHQGDWVTWYPSYAVTAIAFVEGFIFLCSFASVLEKAREGRKGADLVIVAGGQVVPWESDGTKRDAQAKDIAARLYGQMAVEGEAWVQKQMELRRVVEGPKDTVATPVNDLGSQAQAWRQA